MVGLYAGQEITEPGETAMEQHADGSAITRLAALVGEWSMVPEFQDAPAIDTGARVAFEWMGGGRFLIQRWEVPGLDPLDMPAAGIAIIGADPESQDGFLQHYFDSRGVARVYKMSFSDAVWKLWRIHRTSRRWTSRSDSRGRSAPTASRSPDPGRSATTAPPGSTTSI
jgi:hypothetical protein